MSLFAELFTLTKARRFAMLISSNHDTGLLTISIMPRSFGEKDGPYCKDLTLTAKPEEFDAGFIEAIGSYRGKLLPLLEQAKDAAVAIEQSAQKLKSTPLPKSTGKGNTTKAGGDASKPEKPETTVGAQAQAYREASTGEDAEPDDEPNNDWMKNRQPELF